MRLISRAENDGKVRQRGLSLTASIPPAKRIKRDMETGIQEALNGFLGKGATFRSKEQRFGLRAVLEGESPLVVILPTGGEKSLLFMLPAWLEGARTTIVISPFVALANDTERRCKDVGIECIQWRVGREQRAKLVIVSAELAVSKEFMNYATGLHLNEQLDRMVFDECHLVMMAAGFRDAMHKLKTLGLPVPLILLTATLPPTMVREFERALTILKPTYIRESTARPNFSYIVEICDDKRMNEIVWEMVNEIKKDLGEDERVVVFCRSIKRCEELVGLLECEMYHSRYGGKSQGLASWTAGDKKVMVATSALGTGIDLKGITHVVHVERPWSLIEWGADRNQVEREEGGKVKR